MLSGESSFQLDPETTADYFKKGVADPLLREFDLEIAPRLASAFAGSGSTFGSRRGQATGQALEGLTGQLSAELSRGQFANQQLEAGLAESAANRQAQGIQLNQQLNQGQLQRASGLLALNDPFQAYEQSKARAEYEQFLRTQPGANPAINQALAFIGKPQQQLIQEENKYAQPIGMAAGAASGAIAGSAFGPVGTFVGGAAGAVASA